MLGSERVRAVLVGAEPDRTPVQYHFLGGAHSVLARVGTSRAVAYSSPTSIANTQIAAAEMFGHDTVMAPWGCLTVEAQAFGCELNYHDMWYPQVRSRPLTDTTDLSRLSSIGPDLAGRMPLMIDALAELRRRSDGELFVIAMVVSPFLVACELRDMSQLMLDIGLEPTFVAELLETVADGLGTYVDAIAASGAVDAIMFENAGMAAELLGPHHVETFVRPNHRRLVAKARAAAPRRLSHRAQLCLQSVLHRDSSDRRRRDQLRCRRPRTGSRHSRARKTSDSDRIGRPRRADAQRES